MSYFEPKSAEDQKTTNGSRADKASSTRKSSTRRRRISDVLPFTARLPQHDLYYHFRKSDLKSRREDYTYDYEYVSPLAMCKDVPFRDEFSIRWMWGIGERLYTVLNNLMEVESDPYLRKKHQKNLRLYQGLKKAVTFDIEGLLKLLQEAIEMGGAITRPQSSEEYATLFRTIGIPPIHRDLDLTLQIAHVSFHELDVRFVVVGNQDPTGLLTRIGSHGANSTPFRCLATSPLIVKGVT